MARKAQISMEVVMIVGFILLLTVPLMSDALYNLGTGLGSENNAYKLSLVAEAAETVGNFGPGNVYTVYVSEKIIVKDGIAYLGEVSPGAPSIPIPYIEDTTINPGEVWVVHGVGGIKALNPPEVTAMTPTKGTAGDVVGLTGKNFDIDNMNVYFNGETVSFSVITDTIEEITVSFVVPEVTGVFEGDVLDVEVYVQTDFGDSQLDSNFVIFTYYGSGSQGVPI